MKLIAPAIVAVLVASTPVQAMPVVNANIDCAIKLFARLENGSVIELQPDREAALVLFVTVYATFSNNGARADEVRMTLEPYSVSATTNQLLKFVNSAGTAVLPAGTFPISRTIAANSSVTIGPYRINMNVRSMTLRVTGSTDRGSPIRTATGTCSKVVSFSGPPW